MFDFESKMVPSHPPDKFKQASPRKSMGHIGILSGVRCSRNAGKAALQGCNGSLDAAIARRTRKPAQVVQGQLKWLKWFKTTWFKAACSSVQAPTIKADDRADHKGDDGRTWNN
jgi:hypothetical protein